MDKILENLAKIFEQLPGIIREAAKSKMGMIALIVLALSGLSAVFFYNANENLRLIVFLALFLGALLFVGALMRRSASSDSDNETKSKVGQAAAVCYKVVDNQPEFMLIKSSGRRWIFPKGKIDPGEDAWETAQREAFEEAGVSGKIDKKRLGTFIHIKQDLKSSGKEIVIAAYLLEVISTQEPSEKHRNPTWFSYKDAIKAFSEGRASKYFSEYEKVLEKAVDRIDADS